MAQRCIQEIYAPHNACFGCGPSNGMGLRLRSFPDDGSAAGARLVCTFRPEPHHEAFPGVLAGGICATLLDCHSNWTAAYHLMHRRRADSPPCTVTAELHVKLRRPTPMDCDLHLVADVCESTDQRAVVEAVLAAHGTTTATCRGVFVAVVEGHPAYHRW